MTKSVFDLAHTDGRDRYKLLSGLIVPRPIGWIGTVRPDGSFNLAPFSFFNLMATSPPVVVFSAGYRDDRPKDSATLAEESGEFTVNIVSAALAEAMNQTSGAYPPDEDEFAIVGLTAAPGRRVGAPLVAESPANLECRVLEVIDLGSTRLVVGEVLMVHVRDEVLDGTRVRPEILDAVGRMSGATYTYTRDRFDLHRPQTSSGG